MHRFKVMALLTVALVGAPSVQAAPRYGTTTLFATVPAPGHPTGVLSAARGTVYVSTSGGSPFAPGSGEDAVLSYLRKGGHPVGRAAATTSPMMGLHAMAEDGQGRLYVLDMNGRVLRYTPQGKQLRGPEVYSSTPEPLRTLGWQASMWQGLAFAPDGNLYVTDSSLGAIWRVPRGGGPPSVWFQSPELLSHSLSGINGIAIGPDGMLYVVLAGAAAPDRLGDGVVYRLPLSLASPPLTALQVFHRFPKEPGGQLLLFPLPGDAVFGRSGNLYVTLTGRDEIAVLGRDGRELHRIRSDTFDVPTGIAFHGDSVLVANADFIPPEAPGPWTISKVYVGDTGQPLVRPNIP